VHLPFIVRHAHYWTKGVILHADRAPVLPASPTVSPLLRKVRLSAARRALSKGRGLGSLVEPVLAHMAAEKGGSSDSSQARQSSTNGGSASKTTGSSSDLASTKGGSARHLHSSSPRRDPACLHILQKGGARLRYRPEWWHRCCRSRWQCIKWRRNR
jgi:hypothetical protein